MQLNLMLVFRYKWLKTSRTLKLPSINYLEVFNTEDFWDIHAGPEFSQPLFQTLHLQTQESINIRMRIIYFSINGSTNSYHTYPLIDNSGFMQLAVTTCEYLS